jgi:hypothetical protein
MNQEMNDKPLKPHAPDPAGKHSPGPKGSGPAGMNRQAFRSLKCSLSHDEFAVVRWAANRAGKSAMPLAEFFRAALLEKAQAIAGQEVEGGRKLPPEIARLIATAKGPVAAVAERGRLTAPS